MKLTLKWSENRVKMEWKIRLKWSEKYRTIVIFSRPLLPPDACVSCKLAAVLNMHCTALRFVCVCFSPKLHLVCRYLQPNILNLLNILDILNLQTSFFCHKWCNSITSFCAVLCWKYLSISKSNILFMFVSTTLPCKFHLFLVYLRCTWTPGPGVYLCVPDS